MVEKIGVVLAFIILAAGVVYHVSIPQEHRIDCSVAEINPDYSTQEREYCRRLKRTSI